MAVLVDQFATIFVDHSEPKPSCFRFEDPVGSNGAGPRDNGIGWNAMPERIRRDSERWANPYPGVSVDPVLQWHWRAGKVVAGCLCGLRG